MTVTQPFSHAMLLNDQRPEYSPSFAPIEFAKTQPQVVNSVYIAAQEQAPQTDVAAAQHKLLVMQDAVMQCGQTLPTSAQQILLEVVSPSGCYADLHARVESMQPDCLLLMLATVDAQWLSWIEKLHSERPMPIILWVAAHSDTILHAAHAAGVSGYWVGAAAYANLVPNLAFACAQHAQRQALEKRIQTTQKRLDERKWIEKAKGLIMQQNQLTEQEAFAQLRSSAMRQGITLGEIAQRVINVFENYG